MGTKNKFSVLLLAAGLGTRLKPFTDVLPKCLVPIQGIPLLEIWIRTLLELEVDEIYVNLHYKSEIVTEFLNRPFLKGKVITLYEPVLLGTAGTLNKNYLKFVSKPTLLIHADNICICNFSQFIHYHFNQRPSNTLITMMSFRTDRPESCGILELNNDNIVINFHEKMKNPPGNLANGAIYILEPDVVYWIHKNNINDFSNQVIPNFLGRIATWENKELLLDIGTPEQLVKAQNIKIKYESIDDSWYNNFINDPIHKMLKEN